MAITSSLLTSGSDETDADSYVTASITPASNKLILVAVGTRDPAVDGDRVVTLSGNGITWVEVGTLYDDGIKINLFRGLVASPSAGTITISIDQTVLACHWIVVEFTGMDTSGVNGSGAIVQSATNSGTDDASTMAVTLAAFSDVGNATYGAIMINRGSVTAVTPGAGFTELVETSLSNEVSETEFKDTNDTTVDWSWNGTGGATRAAIAVEIKVAAALSIANVVEIGQSQSHPKRVDRVAIY